MRNLQSLKITVRVATDEKDEQGLATDYCYSPSTTAGQGENDDATTYSLDAVKNEALSGCIECDIHVPDHLRKQFSEMCPILKNTEISRDDVGGL